MGFNRVTGTAQNVTGSLVHFKLLDRVDGGYVLPDSTRQLLSMKLGSEGAGVRLKQLALNPELYRYIYDQYKFDMPQNIGDVLVNKFAGRNVTKNNVNSIIGNYLESVSFAGYPVEVKAPNAPSATDSQNGLMEERKGVELDGHYVSISKRYLLEAYEKTLKEDLERVHKQLKVMG